MEMSKLLVKDLMNGKFELISDYIYQIENYVIRVPQGFVTDYASIPRIFRAIVLPYGKVGQVLCMTIFIQRAVS